MDYISKQYTTMQKASGSSTGPILLTRAHFNHSMEKVITSILKCGVKLLIHSQNLTVPPVRLSNR